MAINYSPKIVTEGLSLLFDPANAKSYPGSGSTIYDLSGNGNNGSLAGSPVFSNGYMIYDGVDDSITVPSNADTLNFSIGQTVLIWMYHTYTSGRKNPYDQAYGGYGTWTHENGSNINYYYGDGGGNAQPYTSRNSGTTERNVWNCMAITRDTNNIKWFKNGVQVNSAGNAYGILTTHLSSLRFGTGYAGRWVGNMGPMMLYNRGLTAEEMQQNFNAYRGRFGL